MVFPSVPIYLDPPNWNQQTSATSGSGDVHQFPPPPAPQAVAATGAAVRPGSMAERARLAKIPQPEPALKCPRCDSTNTKFCYFNNYSLSQPRHFCKTCRRYWTSGGALRNVPVGGGCRRNKKSKSSSTAAGSSSTTKSQATVAASASSSSTATSASSLEIFPSAPLPLMAQWHQLPDFGFSAIPQMENAEFTLGGSSSSSAGLEQWRIQQIQQFPFLGGMETSTSPAAPAPVVPGFYSFEGEGVGGMDGAESYPGGNIHGKLTPVKMEDASQGLNLPRQFLNIPRNDQQPYWAFTGGNIGSGGSGGGGGWTGDFSGYNPSSTGSTL